MKKVKTLFLTLAVIIAAFGVVSCENNLDLESTAIDNEIVVNAIVDGQVSGTAITKAVSAKETTTDNLTEFDLIMNTNSWKSNLDTYGVVNGVVNTVNTIYYWPNTTDFVTFRATGAPTAWAAATTTGISKTGYEAGKDKGDDPVVAVSNSKKVEKVDLKFYHVLSRVALHYVGTEYANEESKGIYIVPVSHKIRANVKGDFSFAGDSLKGKWDTGRTDVTTYLLADAWTNQVKGYTDEDTYTISGGVPAKGTLIGAAPEYKTNDWINVIPGNAADSVTVVINVCNAADNTVITSKKVLKLLLPTLHKHSDGTTCPLTQHPGDITVGDKEDGSYDCTIKDGTVEELTGNKFQPGYGYIYDVRFYVKKTVNGDGTDNDYDIIPIVIGAVAVDPWTNNHAGEIIYGK